MFFQAKTLLLCLLFSGTLFQDVPRLKKTKLTDYIVISLPEDFHPMTDDEIAAKYFVARKPLASYSSADRIADFTLNQTVTPGRQQDLPILKDIFKSGIQSNFTKVSFIQETIQPINERDYVILEFTAELRDDDPNSANKGVTRQYSYIVYTTIANKVHVMAFNCPVQAKDRWQPVAKAVMNTIKIKR